jgi:glycosyltransferase involved in cell wall biosynthesis
MAAARRSVCLVAPRLSRGGTTRAYAIAQALLRAGHGARVVGYLPDGEAVYPVPPSGLEVVAVRGRGYATLLRRLVRTIDADVIYAIKPRATSITPALMAARRRRRKVVVDVDDWEFALRVEPDRRFAGTRAARASRHPVRTVRALARRARLTLRGIVDPESRYYARYYERLLARADAVTVSTRVLQGRFGGAYLPSCRDTEWFDPARFDPDAERARLGLGGRTVLMFPGTARWHKGLEDALEAMDRLDREDVRLVVVGGRAVGDAVAGELAARWPRWLVRLGRFADAEMPRVVAAAHVVVVPQRDEPIARAQLPIKLTDAMAMAKPIVTTRVGDIPEVVGEAAWVVDPSSPAAIAAALAEILADPAAAARRGARARERCVTHYSLETVAAALDGLLSGL